MKTALYEYNKQVVDLWDKMVSGEIKLLDFAREMAINYPNALEKEKEQIINTYETGSSHGMGVIEDGLDYIHGIEYFDQTYNQNAK
jgi:hypothetical protein